MNVGEQPICLSGGADGSDLLWGMCAGTAGHQVIHFGFPGHGSKAPKVEQVILTHAQLSEADPFLIRANITLERTFPGQGEYSNNLLRRNYFQQRDTQSMYGVVLKLDSKGRLDGGTAWAFQMFIDRHEGAACAAFVFDQTQDTWLTWDGTQWVRIETSDVPKPTGVWTGIGCRARNLGVNGKNAIRGLLDYPLLPVYESPQLGLPL
jgi:hypothetical protein